MFPLYWITVASFKSPGAIYSYPLSYWPEHFSLENYTGLFAEAQFGVYLTNSLLIATAAGTVATVISMLSAYVLARFEFRTKGAVLMAALVTQTIPSFIALGPLYMMMTELNLVDSRFGLTLVYVAVCIRWRKPP